jgi:hypothetical protein
MRVNAPMPDGRIPRAPGWQIGVAGLCVIAVIVGVRMAILAVQLGSDDVAWWLASIAGELVLACALLRARTRTSLGARSALLFGLAIVGLFPLGMGERPRYPHWSAFDDHETWVLFAALWLLAFCLGVTAHYWIRRLRR